MSLSLPPEDLEAFRIHVRTFLSAHVVPRAEAWARERSVSRELHAAAGGAGLLGLKYELVHGGLHRPYAFTQAMLEEFGASGMMGPLLSLVLQSEFATPHLALHASPFLQDRYLRPAIRGETILSIAMTEPEGGSNLAGLATVAKPVPGGFRVTGRKWMIGNASLADAVCVVCTAPEKTPEGQSALSLLIVDAGQGGFKVVRQLEKIGLHATPNCELAFEDCFVPEENLVGRQGLAAAQLLVGNVYERVGIAILASAAMRAGWEDAVRFLSERRSGDRALIDLSPWRHVMMQDYMELEGCDRVLRDAAASIDRGRPDQPLVLMAKVMATEACQRVLHHATQALGARGFLSETRVGRLAADARALTIGGGASEVLTDALSRLVIPRVLRRRPS